MTLQHLNHGKIYLVLMSICNIQPYCLNSAFSALYNKFYPVAGGVPREAGCDDCVHSFVIRYQFARYKVSGTGAAKRRYDLLY
jgi:hypothetical protein